jgi:hypothetical protein
VRRFSQRNYLPLAAEQKQVSRGGTKKENQKIYFTMHIKTDLSPTILFVPLKLDLPLSASFEWPVLTRPVTKKSYFKILRLKILK